MAAIDVESKAKEIKRLVVKTITKAKGGHIGTSLSEVDILATLYFGILNVDAQRPDYPDRDRFILSKGHGSEGLYCSLAAKGFFPEAELESYLQHDCPMTIHPTRHVPGVEMNTGALGHGFSNAVGVALAARLRKRPFRAFVLTGDGELQEGSNWEAAMAAAHFELGNLVLIVDNNGLQLADRIDRTMGIEPLGAKLEAFGFDVHPVDGHSIPALLELFSGLDYAGKKPHAVVARTTKGKGVSFMEGVPEWHHRIPTPEEGARALKELGL
jgi:transketolase